MINNLKISIKTLKSELSGREYFRDQYHIEEQNGLIRIFLNELIDEPEEKIPEEFIYDVPFNNYILRIYTSAEDVGLELLLKWILRKVTHSLYFNP